MPHTLMPSAMFGECRGAHTVTEGDIQALVDELQENGRTHSKCCWGWGYLGPLCPVFCVPFYFCDAMTRFQCLNRCKAGPIRNDFFDIVQRHAEKLAVKGMQLTVADAERGAFADISSARGLDGSWGCTVPSFRLEFRWK